MKIKHNFKILEDWVTIEGQILETIFEEWEERGEFNRTYSKDKKFYISSAGCPELYDDVLCVWGNGKEYDNQTISCTYETPEEAQKVLSYINEFTQMKKETITVDGVEYRYVYVSDVSEEHALKGKDKRILLYSLPWTIANRHITVAWWYEIEFINWEEYCISRWRYIAEIPEEKTISIKTKDWQELEISEEKAKELWFTIK